MKIKVKQPTRRVVSVGIQGPNGLSQVLEALDVDKTILEDGAILVYNESTETFVTTRYLEKQVIEAGYY